MSSVKIQGSATGTANFTIAVPEGTSTDRTINLADEAGTFVTKDANNNIAGVASINGSQIGGRRNVLINSDFSIAQRSSGPVTGSGFTTVDRWMFPTSGQTSEQVANDRVSHLPYMLKSTASSSGYGIIRQLIEDVRTLSGQKATLSFWAKSADASTFRLEIQQVFGSGGSATVTVINNATYWSVPNTDWNFYSVTVDMPSTLSKTVGTNSYISLLFGPNSGTSGNVVYYSEVMFEAGEVATPHEHRSYGEELSACQRYYWEYDSDGVGTYLWSGAYTVQTATAMLMISFPCTMRAAPTVGSYSTSNVSGMAVTTGSNFCRFSGNATASNSVSKITTSVPFDAEL